MIRTLTLAASALALLAACAAPPTTGAGASALAGVQRAGPQCVAENQNCGRDASCCSGTVCMPSGRFGSLCRTPFPN